MSVTKRLPRLELPTLVITVPTPTISSLRELEHLYEKYPKIEPTADSASVRKQLCLVLDFDCTITSFHLYRLLYEYKAYIRTLQAEVQLNLQRLVEQMRHGEQMIDKTAIETLFGGSDRLTMIKEFIKSVGLMDVDIFISSRGNFPDIYHVLKCAEIDQYITNINARGARNNQSKSFFISETLQSHYDCIFYVDDDASSFHQITIANDGTGIKYFGSSRSTDIGLKCVDIDLEYEAQGLTKNAMDKILETICEKLHKELPTKENPEASCDSIDQTFMGDSHGQWSPQLTAWLPQSPINEYLLKFKNFILGT